MSHYILGMIIFSLLPFVFGILSLLFWFFLRILKPLRFKETYLANSFATFLVFTYLFYPSIVNYGFSMINCIEVENELYLVNDMGIKCWGTEHKKILYQYTLPIVIIWIIGFPLFIFY